MGELRNNGVIERAWRQVEPSDVEEDGLVDRRVLPLFPLIKHDKVNGIIIVINSVWFILATRQVGSSSESQMEPDTNPSRTK